MPNGWNRNGQYSGQATLTHKVNGARDIVGCYFIELADPKNMGNKKKFIVLACLMAEIEMVSIVVKRPWPTRSAVHAT